MSSDSSDSISSDSSDSESSDSSDSESSDSSDSESSDSSDSDSSESSDSDSSDSGETSDSDIRESEIDSESSETVGNGDKIDELDTNIVSSMETFSAIEESSDPEKPFIVVDHIDAWFKEGDQDSQLLDVGVIRPDDHVAVLDYDDDDDDDDDDDE
jgi:hypothetical protein